jgi:hypothetical protein
MTGMALNGGELRHRCLFALTQFSQNREDPPAVVSGTEKLMERAKHNP